LPHVYCLQRTTTKNGKSQLKSQQLQQRLESYHATCQKYSKEIAAIQKYLPGWMPMFEAKVKGKSINADFKILAIKFLLTTDNTKQIILK
jgi:hypothetical protein